MKTKNVLVTGGAGFIGSNFVRIALKEKKWRITNLDLLLTGGRKENLRKLSFPENHVFVKGDIANQKLVSRLVKQNDLVINFAAESHVDRSITNPESFVYSNIIGLHSILNAIKKHRKPLLQISTDEVYGSIEKGSATEKTLLNPSSPYSASKAAADLLCLSYVKTYNCKIAITRSSNNYGPYQHPEKFIPTTILSCLKGKKIPIYGKGENQRDWIYVEDNVWAILKVVEKADFNGEIYNIGTGKKTKNIDIANKILLLLNGKGIKHVKDRPGHDYRYSISTKKIKKLGWKPKTSLKKGLKKTIEWYKKNKWWWKKP